MLNQIYTWYNGHGVFSTSDLSSSYIPRCDDNQFSMTTSLSGVPNYIWIDELYKKTETDILNEIHVQCRSMLCDVLDTNNKARSLSAFVSVFALIGTLAKLAFQGNPDYVFSDQKDLRMYLTLLDRYVLDYQDTKDFAKVINRHGLSETLYRKVRCGLLHGGTLINDKMPNDERITPHLSHQSEDARPLKEIDCEIIKLQSGQLADVDFVIGIKAMTQAIQDIITKMFKGDQMNGIDASVKTSILSVYKKEPFVIDPHYLK